MAKSVEKRAFAMGWAQYATVSVLASDIVNPFKKKKYRQAFWSGYRAAQRAATKLSQEKLESMK